MNCVSNFKFFFGRNRYSNFSTPLKSVKQNLSYYIFDRHERQSKLFQRPDSYTSEASPNHHIVQKKFSKSFIVNKPFNSTSNSNTNKISLTAFAVIILVSSFIALGQYKGDFVNESRTRKGIFTFADGSQYNGDLMGSKIHGKGIYTRLDGTRYEGDFVKGKFHGKGILTFPSGSRYEGDFANGNRNGKGTYIDASGSRYEGDFVNDKSHGKGILTRASGTRYEGDFVNNKFHGRGIYTESDGNRYEGPWLENWPGDWKKNKNLFTFEESSSNELKPIPFPSQAIILQTTYDLSDAFGLKGDRPQKLSDALKIGGYESKVIFFHSKKDLEEKIKGLDQKVSLIWIRAHGSGPEIGCGKTSSELADEKILSKLNPLLTNESFIVLESCLTGMPNMLAQKMLNRLCDEGKRPLIVAPNGTASFVGIDLADLQKGKLTIPMLSAEKNLENVSTIFKCPT